MDIQQKKPNKASAFDTATVVAIALEMGFIIALPIVFLGLLGKWLDNRYHTGFFVYIGILLALFSSTFWLYSRFDQMLKKMNESAKGKENNQQK